MKGLVTVPSCGLGGQEDPSVLKTDPFAKQIILRFAKVFFFRRHYFNCLWQFESEFLCRRLGTPEEPVVCSWLMHAAHVTCFPHMS